ncbi:MAG: 4-(cytidine 5'-diphospho)-2-C-methyl-D-erythritol kinase [Pseudomonadota bacterium]
MTTPFDSVENAPAKLNLFLHVTGQRDDGYHLLDSLVCFASVGDRLEGRLRDDGDITCTLTGPMANALGADGLGDLAPEDNLVMRAARLLQDHYNVTAGADLRLHKTLPVASGIGGGSADAAAALRLLCRLWKIEPDPLDLGRMALVLGADVPVCLVGGTVLMQGIGEILHPVPPLPDFPIVLVNPGTAVSTPKIFAARAGEFTDNDLWDRHARFDTIEDLVTALQDCRNDLTYAAIGLSPEICDVIAALGAEEGCLLARMSGSGATCFGLYGTPDAAQKAAKILHEAHPDWWVVAGQLAGDAFKNQMPDLQDKNA